MTRDHLEAFIWRHWPTRGTLAGRHVAAILDAADAYADTRRRGVRPEPARPVLCHTSETDLYPLISALASALLDDRKGLEWDGQLSPGDRREMADAMGLDPWAGAA